MLLGNCDCYIYSDSTVMFSLFNFCLETSFHLVHVATPIREIEQRCALRTSKRILPYRRELKTQTRHLNAKQKLKCRSKYELSNSNSITFHTALFVKGERYFNICLSFRTSCNTFFPLSTFSLLTSVN